MFMHLLLAGMIISQAHGDFPLVKLNGDTVWFSSFKGKPLVVIFWSPWCPHCQHELPEINKLYEKYHKSGVNFIGITRADKSILEDNIRKHNIKYPEFINAMDVINQPIFGEIPGVPTTFIFDSQGNVYFKQIGYVPSSVFDDKLNELLQKEKSQRKKGFWGFLKGLFGGSD